MDIDFLSYYTTFTTECTFIDCRILKMGLGDSRDCKNDVNPRVCRRVKRAQDGPGNINVRKVEAYRFLLENIRGNDSVVVCQAE